MQPVPFVPWVWRDPSWTDEPDQDQDLADRPDTGLIGYEVEATDGGIGKIDQDNAKVPHDCLMVDTGPWIFGRKVVLPVGTVRHVDHAERKVHVDRTKEQIKNAPEYDPDDHDDYRKRTDEYYTDSYRLMPPML
ncbi:PRC-barrel domain containing protein [Lentzea sp. BCCO 10_0798]|uniref:PRC-barrel domain containing protein n=1 Tax=Lentzea kristufekii TaxID=3095430 RepID=A0ABU4TN88_9PSEU|nr:PRC-barrel domain containing protein [Lentzea sp. BCCO 10_0798]MDX8049736.1 PRC-barrel domain containing protein [Lentzea sp. BCCO 10_0798]